MGYLPDNAWHCWVAASGVELNGDLNSVPVVDIPVPTNESVPPPTGLSAVRNGDNVTITWNAAAAAEGYLIEAKVCDNGLRIWLAFSTGATQITIQDEQTCGSAGKGEIRTFNMLGYSQEVIIPWP